MSDSFNPERTATAALDDISSGGQKLISMALDRIEAAQTALMEGRFVDTDRLLNEALGKVGPLANAQHAVGGWGNLAIIRAHELAVGMRLYGGREVYEVEAEDKECGSGTHPDGHTTVRVVFADKRPGVPDEAQFSGEQEVTVFRDSITGGGFGF